MAALEDDTDDDAALFLGPGCSIAVRGTGISEEFGIWAVG